LGGLLRRSFGFDGVIATDCGALADAHLHHKRYATEVETVTAAIRAGVDSNCGSYLPTALPWAIGNGTLRPSDLAPAARRLLNMRFRLGLFEEDHPAVPRASLSQVCFGWQR
jgi:beta-glucosidase-like glycosyl hydrolase